MKKYFSLLVFYLLLSLSANSQDMVKGIVIEKDTKLPIAFATVSYQVHTLQKGVVSDIHGKFIIRDSLIKSIAVSCVGFRKKTVWLKPDNDKTNIVIELQVDTISLNEVVIRPGDNPAIAIIKNVLKHKDENNYERYDKYRYRCYNKTIYDIKLSNDASAEDSATLLNNQALKKRAFIVFESVALCSRKDNKTENKIIATKTSGFKNPMLNQIFFTFFHNAISFYNNHIPLFQIPFDDKTIDSYLSPISDGCFSSYRYQLDESYDNGTDSVFVITFFPKKGANFNSLHGKLYISSNGYAITSIIAEPFQKGLIDFKFHQKYEFINGKWFPSKLDEEIGFASFQMSKKFKAYPVYLVNSTVDSVDYKDTFNKGPINLDNVYIDHNSVKNTDSILKKVRIDSLTVREKSTYQFMDSLGKRYHFDNWLTLIPKLAVGRIPVKCFDIELSKIYGYNKYEGARWGIGARTNEIISKFISVGGFVGYGSKDKKYKYGGQVIFDLNKYHQVQVKFLYQDNLKEPGRDMVYDEALYSMNDYNRNFIAYRFDRFIEQRAEFGFRTLRYLKLTAVLSLRELKPTYDSFFKNTRLTDYRADEIQLSARYACNERLETVGDQRIINYEGNPIFSILYKSGISLFHPQSYRFHCIEGTMDVVAYKGTVGQSKIRLAGGYIDRSLPYSLLFTGEGSKNNSIPLVINHSFQTMSPYEFLSDKYVNLFYSHNFGSLLFETRKFKPQFVVVQNTGWGTLANSGYQGLDFKIKDKVYLESGLIINNIIRFNIRMFYLGFGMGAFYRYGSYRYDKISNNFALKLSLSFSLK
jgi:hypothetical protein